MTTSLPPLGCVPPFHLILIFLILPPLSQDIEDFKMRFSKFDLDGSGAIDRVEFKMLLEDMGIRVRDSVRERLIREIDLNGNGTIE